MREYSYGIIPLQRKGKTWEVLLVQHYAGHWAFPKGHAEKGESAQETAERELREETGLTVSSYLKEEPFSEQYFFMFKGKRIFKTVQYFLAEVEGDVKIQEAEISQSQWVPLDQAADFITFPEAKKLCKKVQESVFEL